ncbi:MAG: DUF11 domain-containing protein, partial [Firmicutes bacterium]|nr:DUF11 domain-containing protein [Bacillota bacterium]
MAALGPIITNFDLCDEAIIVASNEAVVEIVDLQIVKEADVPYTVVGKTICYTITVTNHSALNIETLFTDEIQSYLTYIDASFLVDDVPQTPDIQNNVL